MLNHFFQDLENEIEFVSSMGSGAFCTTFKGVDNRTGEDIVIKVLRECKEERLNTVCSLNCPSLVNSYAYGIFSSKFCVLQEYIACGCIESLMDCGPLEEIECAFVIREILKGVVFLHENNIVHCSISPENILIGTKGEVKLTGFMEQYILNLNNDENFTRTVWSGGPEMAKSTKLSEKSDIWGIGMTTIQLITGEHPFGDLHPMRALMMIIKIGPPVFDGIGYSNEILDFISKCTDKEPANRPTAQELLQHPFIQLADDLDSLQSLIHRAEEYNSIIKGVFPLLEER